MDADICYETLSRIAELANFSEDDGALELGQRLGEIADLANNILESWIE